MVYVHIFCIKDITVFLRSGSCRGRRWFRWACCCWNSLVLWIWRRSSRKWRLNLLLILALKTLGSSPWLIPGWLQPSALQDRLHQVPCCPARSNWLLMWRQWWKQRPRRRASLWWCQKLTWGLENVKGCRWLFWLNWCSFIQWLTSRSRSCG